MSFRFDNDGYLINANGQKISWAPGQDQVIRSDYDIKHEENEAAVEWITQMYLEVMQEFRAIRALQNNVDKSEG
jgi:hypothetical protein